MDTIVHVYDWNTKIAKKEFWTVSLRTIITPDGTFTRDLNWENIYGTGCCHYFMEKEKGNWLRITSHSGTGSIHENCINGMRDVNDEWDTVCTWKTLASE